MSIYIKLGDAYFISKEINKSHKTLITKKLLGEKIG